MDAERLQGLLEAASTGGTAVAGAFSDESDATTPEARLDHHRPLRLGAAEAVFGEFKTGPQIVRIAAELMDQGTSVLVTRVEPQKAAAVRDELPELDYTEAARTLTFSGPDVAFRNVPKVSILAAGTSDIGVAEEAAVTLETVRLRTDRIYDVGVAGLHRLLGEMGRFRDAPAVIVVAGMEAALGSVVGGLIGAPVIAVPTSVGYGVSLSGLTALFGMLNSCAAGVTVMNIDNGFGAAMAVHRIINSIEACREVASP